MEVEMHDINRTQMEAWETGLTGGYEYEDSEYEFEDSEYEDFEYEDTEYEMYPETYGEAAGPLSEADEMELAAQLLEVTDEQELDQFIGKLFNKVKKVAGAYLPAGVRNSLGGMAKKWAKRLLPIAGNFIAPGVGGVIGGKLASMATEVFGLELEGLSAEDQEFEVARQHVRLVSDAAQEAANVPPTAPPQVAAKQGLQNSAEKHAPGLLAKANGQASLQVQQRPGQRGTPTAMRGGVRVIRIHPRQKLLIVRG